MTVLKDFSLYSSSSSRLTAHDLIQQASSTPPSWFSTVNVPRSGQDNLGERPSIIQVLEAAIQIAEGCSSTGVASNRETLVEPNEDDVEGDVAIDVSPPGPQHHQRRQKSPPPQGPRHPVNDDSECD